MTVVVPWKPLVMLRGVRAHPRCDGLSRCVVDRITQVLVLSGERVQLGGGELHVVRPVVFFVVVGRTPGSSLANAGILLPDVISRECLRFQLSRESGICRPIHGRGQRESGRVFAGSGCQAIRAILVFEKSLWLS